MLLLVLFLAFLTLIEGQNSGNVYVVHDKESDSYRLVNGSRRLTANENVGWATLTNNITITGWSVLEVHTNPSFPDSIQAYYAGLMEGAVTRGLIRWQWKNTIGDYCKDRDTYCNRLEQFLRLNLEYMNENIDKNRKTCPYWHQVGLLLEQVAGLQDGFDGKASQPHRNISLFGLYLFDIDGDVEDLEVILKKPSGRRRLLGAGKCSALVKLLPNNADLFASQVTWSDFVSMVRILKHYHLGLHVLPEAGSPLIAGQSSSFSSYPGTLQSGDDFYVISSGLVSMETTIGNGNETLYEGIKPQGILLEWIRSLVANRLASNGSQWAAIFTELNSGTYNNQWMIIDYNLFTPGEPLKDNLLTVLEQIPTLIVSKDVTDILRQQTYWPSYNIPYFEEVFNMSGGPGSVAQFGDWFTYDKSPRALIFKRDNRKVHDLDSMIKLMRYNDYTRDPLSRCECSPPYSAENAVSARSDLNPSNGTYPFSALGHRSHGATDMKVTSYALQKDRLFVAIGGPPHEDVPAFQWSKSDFEGLSHEGHPDLWVFGPLVQPWDLSAFADVTEVTKE